MIDKLAEDAAIVANDSAKQGLEEMKILVSLLRAYKVIDKVSSPTLAHVDIPL